MCYLLTVAWLVWNPTPSAPSGAVRGVTDLAARLGVTISTTTAEFCLNVLMLVPLSLLGGLLFRRLSVPDWTTVGFLVSTAIEVVQRLVLPTRTGSSRDIVANTAGALIGAVLLLLLLAAWEARRARRPAG